MREEVGRMNNPHFQVALSLGLLQLNQGNRLYLFEKRGQSTAMWKRR